MQVRVSKVEAAHSERERRADLLMAAAGEVTGWDQGLSIAPAPPSAALAPLTRPSSAIFPRPPSASSAPGGVGRPRSAASPPGGLLPKGPPGLRREYYVGGRALEGEEEASPKTKWISKTSVEPPPSGMGPAGGGWVGGGLSLNLVREAFGEEGFQGFSGFLGISGFLGFSEFSGF